MASTKTATYEFLTDYTGGFATNPGYMVDGDDDTYATTDAAVGDQTNTTNTGGSYLGDNISKVEILTKHYRSHANNKMYLYPKFNGVQGTQIDITGTNLVITETASDVTSDGQAPATWTWDDVKNLDARLYGDWESDECRVYYVKVRVTYEPAGGHSGTVGLMMI